MACATAVAGDLFLVVITAWVGRSETARDTTATTPVTDLAAKLGRSTANPAGVAGPAAVAAGTLLHPLWHRLYSLPMHRQSDIGANGHAKRGGSMPPVPLAQCMWAGSYFEFRAPVRVGDAVARTPTITGVTQKEGRTGPAGVLQGAARCALQRRGRPSQRADLQRPPHSP